MTVSYVYVCYIFLRLTFFPYNFYHDGKTSHTFDIITLIHNGLNQQPRLRPELLTAFPVFLAPLIVKKAFLKRVYLSIMSNKIIDTEYDYHQKCLI